jgi:hypothetical protein
LPQSLNRMIYVSLDTFASSFSSHSNTISCGKEKYIPVR